MLISLLLAFSGLIRYGSSLGQEPVVTFKGSKSTVQLVGANVAGGILIDGADWPGVLKAGDDLAADFGRVTGKNLTVTLMNTTSTGGDSPVPQIGSGPHIIVGTIGNSTMIDSMVKSGKLDVSKIQGKWESFQTQMVSNPMNGVSDAMVVVGSDKRGTIYGLYDISEQIGVSPWYWFADIAPTKHAQIYAMNKTKVQGPPSVKYRGFFLNDEQPALNNWIQANYPNGKYGPGFNAQFYSHVFELILRLRANYFWPAEWNSMFWVDDAHNAPTANAMGVVIGTSHTEPLQRATKEQSLFLKGPWNWSTNNASIYEFLTEGAERSKPYEGIYTMGMRGLGDTASPTITASSLGQIVDAQQKILSTVFKETNISSIPQMWCLYKEVGGYYADGLRVADDITLLWADDNWGNNQRLPLANETDRAGGAGVYYHFDYVGAPVSYKWINTISLQKTWEQMHLAYERSARQIWIVNVGDLKPLEVPISHFLDLAYDSPMYSSPNSTMMWLEMWATREFGTAVSTEVASIMNTYSMYAGRRKYEMVDPTIYSLINYNEANNVLSGWENLTARAQVVYNKLAPAAQPGFFELVLHPCMAGTILHQIHITVAKNNLYAQQSRTSANVLASEAQEYFNQDYQLALRYHQLLGGKWNHMMDQTHLGQQPWFQQVMRNVIPQISYVQPMETSLAGPMGMTVEGSNGSISGDNFYNIGNSNYTLIPPPMDPYGTPNRYIEIYSRGTEAFKWQVSPYDDWVTATPSSGSLSATANHSDVRVLLTVDWSKAPAGSSTSWINVTISSGNYGNYYAPTVYLPLNKTSVAKGFHGFVESDGHVSIEPEHFTKNVTTSKASAYYAVIPGYGRTLSGVTLLPVLAPSQTSSGPYLEYSCYFFTNTSKANVTVYLSPSLNTNPERPLKYGVAIGDAKPTIVQPVPTTPLGTLPLMWTEAVSNASASNTTMHKVTAGASTLKLWALEPGVVFQKVVVDLGGVRPSYLGPPESPRV